MKFKSGDEVFIKAEITDVSGYECSERPYFVAPDIYSVNWVSEDKIIPMDKTYEMGLNDAWKLAKKIGCVKEEGGMSCDVLEDVYGFAYAEDVFAQYTVEEALAKIEAYEKEKEIKVGDVVRYGIGEDIGKYAIVMRIEGNEFYTMYADGSCGRETHTEDFKKTGKHIDIESLLKEIGE